MSNPYFSVNENGVFTVDTSAIKSAFETAYKNALGQTLNINDGVQKQLILNDTETLVNVMNDCVNLLNADNIFYSTGNLLDIVASRFGYYRKTDVATVVNATLTGTADTYIPVGSKVSNGTNEFELLEGVTIGEEGTVIGQFQCTESGAIPCLAGTLTQILPESQVVGWDTITNENNGILGFDSESDNTFRQRALNTLLQMRAKTLLGAITANVGQVNDVQSVKVLENPTNQTVVKEGVEMIPYSIFVCVLGGLGSDIAEVLAKTKTLGCPMVGDTVVTYYDEVSQYNNNYKIQRPAISNIDVEITYSPTVLTPPDIQDRLKEVLQAYIQENPMQISQTISSFYLNQAFKDFSLAQVFSLKVKLHDDEDFGDYAIIDADQIAQLIDSNISFLVV